MNKQEPSPLEAVEQIEAARALIECLRDLHKSKPWHYGSTVCVTCHVTWPCPTADALEAASRSESTDARRVATPGFAERVVMQACPVCNGRGFVSSAHYNVTGIGTTATTNAETCRTCHGKAIILTGATSEPVTARAETDEGKR